MKFTKMHGTGNDYVYINCFEENVKNPPELARRVSNRNFGIGSDGLILIKPSDLADCKMEMYNADGSKGEMCGNGIRCVAKYIYEKGISKKQTMAVEILSGVKELELEIEDDKVQFVVVNMGKPQILKIDILDYEATCISMGNPHCVIFVPNTEEAKVEIIGPFLEKNKVFAEGTNVEFVQVINREKIKMRVWERGSGETLSCGTGACASAVAAIINNFTEDKIEVEVLGGRLWIYWDRESGFVHMKGSAIEVFSGEFSEEFLGEFL